MESCHVYQDLMYNGGTGITFIHFLKKIIYLFLVVLGLHCYAQAFSSSGERGLLTVVASLIAELGL